MNFTNFPNQLLGFSSAGTIPLHPPSDPSNPSNALPDQNGVAVHSAAFWMFPSSTGSPLLAPHPTTSANLFGQYTAATPTASAHQPSFPAPFGPATYYHHPQFQPYFLANNGCHSEAEEKIGVENGGGGAEGELIQNAGNSEGGQKNQMAMPSSNRHNPRHIYGPGTNNLRIRTRDQYRIVYTEYQRMELEREFAAQEFINSERKAMLSEKLHLTERQIKIWFQNRRAKKRRDCKRLAQSRHPLGTTMQHHHHHHHHPIGGHLQINHF